MSSFASATLDTELIATVRKEIGNEISNSMTDIRVQRFITSNENSVEKAVGQIRSWFVWWTTVLPEESDRGVTPKNTLQFDLKHGECVKKYMKLSFNGVDKEGRPVYWEKQGECSSNFSKVKKDLSVDAMLNLHIRQERLLELCCAHQSARLGRHVGKHVKVADMAGMSMVPDSNELDYIKKMIAVDDAYHPDCMHRLIFINAPWYFSSLFNLMKMFMSEKAVGKISVYSTDFLPKLLEIMDKDQIPECFGGSHSG
jgi:hypothetical protein